MRSLIVIGTRPEAIKCAPVALALPECVVVTTGQHDVLDTLKGFGITPDFSSPFPSHIHDHVRDITDAIAAYRPDVIVVQGDTNSVVAGAIAAHLAGVAVAHVEAGIRTHDLGDPWPEEGWRRMVAQVARYNFAPTERAADNLRTESAPGEIHITGNTVIDALVLKGIERTTGGPDILVELHRRESIGTPLRRACEAVRALSRRYKVTVLAHPNPAVRAIVRDVLPEAIEPLPYDDFIRLLASSLIVISDSGGLQEEASYLGVPMLVTRDVTERMEAVEAGCSVLVGTSPLRIIENADRVLRDVSTHDRMSRAACPYGDGHAAEKIAGVLA